MGTWTKTLIAATPIKDGKFQCACCAEWFPLDVSDEALQEMIVEAKAQGFTDPNDSTLVCHGCYNAILAHEKGSQ